MDYSKEKRLASSLQQDSLGEKSISTTKYNISLGACRKEVRAEVQVGGCVCLGGDHGASATQTPTGKQQLSSKFHDSAPFESSIGQSGTVIDDQLKFIWHSFGTLWHSLDGFEWRENSQLV
jgi:hypothetical protein